MKTKYQRSLDLAQALWTEMLEDFDGDEDYGPQVCIPILGERARMCDVRLVYVRDYFSDDVAPPEPSWHLYINYGLTTKTEHRGLPLPIRCWEPIPEEYLDSIKPIDEIIDYLRDDLFQIEEQLYKKSQRIAVALHKDSIENG